MSRQTQKQARIAVISNFLSDALVDKQIDPEKVVTLILNVEGVLEKLSVDSLLPIRDLAELLAGYSNDYSMDSEGKEG